MILVAERQMETLASREREATQRDAPLQGFILNASSTHVRHSYHLTLRIATIDET